MADIEGEMQRTGEEKKRKWDFTKIKSNLKISLIRTRKKRKRGNVIKKINEKKIKSKGLRRN